MWRRGHGDVRGQGEAGDHEDEEGSDVESDVGGEDGVLACPSHDGGGPQHIARMGEGEWV